MEYPHIRTALCPHWSFFSGVKPSTAQEMVNKEAGAFDNGRRRTQLAGTTMSWIHRGATAAAAICVWIVRRTPTEAELLGHDGLHFHRGPAFDAGLTDGCRCGGKPQPQRTPCLKDVNTSDWIEIRLIRFVINNSIRPVWSIHMFFSSNPILRLQPWHYVSYSSSTTSSSSPSSA